MKKQKWPAWWGRELEFSPHVLKRMVDRRFTEVDLRRMLEHATGCRADVVQGRWAIGTRHNKKNRAVIVEPDNEQKALVVVTAYPVEELK